MKKIEFKNSLITGKSGFDAFAQIQNDIITADEEIVELDINIDKRMGLSFAFCISALPLLAKHHGKKNYNKV